MWRSFFLAIGITLVILGGECLVVDRAYVSLPSEKAPAPKFYQTQAQAILGARKEVVPPEWAPWSLLAAGAVVSLYSLTVARQS